DGSAANATGYSSGMAQPNHEGYGSYRIDQIADGVAVNPPEGHSALPIETTLDNNDPDVVLMMLGTNDAVQNYDPESTYSLDQTTAAFDERTYSPNDVGNIGPTFKVLHP